VAVMYVGRLVEMAPTDELFATPQHPYTAALLSAVPAPDPRQRAQRLVLQGEVANPAAPPPVAPFTRAVRMRWRSAAPTRLPGRKSLRGIL
jgi:oligopeptide/dipeptide ABC transporter ATP-binding protein